MAIGAQGWAPARLPVGLMESWSSLRDKELGNLQGRNCRLELLGQHQLRIFCRPDWWKLHRKPLAVVRCYHS